MSTQPSLTQLPLSELSSIPIDPCHAELIKHHYDRLVHNIHSTPEHAIGRYTNKQAACEQLARMTLIIRDYIEHFKKCRESGRLEVYDEPIESMISDVVEASLTTTGAGAKWSEAVFVNSQLWGREQEIMTIMQEQSAESVDDVLELWNTPQSTLDSPKVLPDHAEREELDLGKDIDWNQHLLRYRSQSNLNVFRRDLESDEFEIEDFGQWSEDLLHRKLEELDLQWPPVFKDPEPNTGRQRGRVNTGINSSRTGTTRASSRGLSSTEHGPAVMALRERLLALERTRGRSSSRRRRESLAVTESSWAPSQALSTRESRERMLAEAKCSEAESVVMEGGDAGTGARNDSRAVSTRNSKESMRSQLTMKDCFSLGDVVI